MLINQPLSDEKSSSCSVSSSESSMASSKEKSYASGLKTPPLHKYNN